MINICYFSSKADFSLIEQSCSTHPINYFDVNNGSDSLTNQHLFYYWEGTQEDNNCTCDYQDKEYGCLRYVCEVSDIFNLTLISWKNTTFISQKSSNYNYSTLIKRAKLPNELCDEGYKQCGLLDSFNQKLCLLENETCPLNQIEISTSKTPSDIFTNKSAVISTPLNYNMTYLHTSNAEINSRVITGIVIGPESFCMKYDERKLGPPFYEYDFLLRRLGNVHKMILIIYQLINILNIMFMMKMGLY